MYTYVQLTYCQINITFIQRITLCKQVCIDILKISRTVLQGLIIAFPCMESANNIYLQVIFSYTIM